MATEHATEQAQIGNFYRERAKDFVELHDQVQTSVTLLDNLESFLSTFQKDLAAVAGQISELQDRSKDIDSRLKSRKRIERPLSSLLSEITIPPPLAAIILDTNVGEPWIDAIIDFERRLVKSRARTRVKAARDLAEVIEGLRIVAATKLRAFFTALFQPIRGSVTTNMQVIQTSVLLKYSPLYAFLQRHAPNVALELQRSYIGAARLYYETGFRRYIRSLNVIKGRTTDKFESIVNIKSDANIHLERLQHAKIDGPGVTLAYMADDKTHKEYVESLLRSLLLVFMDNATAEYSFVSTFFAPQRSLPPAEPRPPLPASASILSPDGGTFTEPLSGTDSDFGAQNPLSSTTPGLGGFVSFVAKSKEELAVIDGLWKSIMDPVMEYCQAFVRSIVDPIPPTIPLLTMIRLAEDVVAEVQRRHCPPAESYVFGLSLNMWPVFQKGMTEHIDSLKKLAEGTSSGYFSRAMTTTDATVSAVCEQYVAFFNSFVFLTDNEAENMIFSNLLRLRQEVAKLITKHTSQGNDTLARAKAQSTIYGLLLQGLSKGTHHTAHLKLQQEIAHWAYLEEETKRKIVSAGQSRQGR
ncbi:vacuolar sorting protein [Crassisporium funariophilum]|nr:vacuolar sorting protein [Crassisporium funariophilum]